MTMSVKGKSFQECEAFVLTFFFWALSCETTEEITATFCNKVVEWKKSGIIGKWSANEAGEV